MRNKAWIGLLAATLTAGAAKAPTYILNGYSFGRMPGVNTAELAAKLKDKEGARVTRADIAVDQAILVKELQARHIKGQLFTTLAEKHGRIWIIFDVLDSNGPAAKTGKPLLLLASQSFEGASRISTSALAAATGLKHGDLLSAEKINAARQANDECS
jgi:hypothetical protein